MKTSSTKPYLFGWKEIATYLGKAVRSVQRYERCLGLPVRRPAGKAGGSIIATKAEIDAWVLASPIRKEFQLAGQHQDTSDTTTAAIKMGVEEMCRLRNQMIDLRSEVNRCVQLLAESVCTLQGELYRNRWEEIAPPAIPGNHPQTDRNRSLSEQDIGRGKAS
jgi:hypothetical protein